MATSGTLAAALSLVEIRKVVFFAIRSISKKNPAISSTILQKKSPAIKPLTFGMVI